ncbi:hypothetical protein GOBAR_DD07896 [Gossypium barbadense]|nr:hypothetical protein GOBAR_DD07896 [Gossypium barbadense]
MVESDTKSGLLESLHDVHSFDSEGNNSPKSDTRIDMGNPDLKTGMVFANREVLKEAIRQYGSLNRYKSEIYFFTNLHTTNNFIVYVYKFILGAKDKLILTCVDTVMTKIIQRIAQKKEAKKVIEPLCPKIQKKLDTKTELCNRGAKQWSQVQSIEPIQPLLLRRPPGKPRKARKKGVDEAQLLVKDGRGGHANELHEMWWSIGPQCATPQSATLTPPTDTLKPTTQGPETARNTTRFKEKLLVSI